MSKVINWLKTHPAFFGPALTSVAIAASLYLLIDPITVLFIAAIALVAGLNNEVVGRSVPGGFSYVDRPPGIRRNNGNGGRKCGYVPIGSGRDEVHQDNSDTRHTRRPCHADTRIPRTGTIRHKPP
jgi:hypothetical protein